MLATWVVAALLVPLSINQLDTLAGKLMTLRAALRRRRWNKKRSR